MKKIKSFKLLLIGTALSFMACNNSTDTSAANPDSSGVNNTPATTATTTENSANDYSAFADTVAANSEKGYYLNAKTGKPYKKLNVNRSTGEITDETNAPVWRYVDNRNWWVYGIDDTDWNWGTRGEAKMDKDKLTYKSDAGKWEDYDTHWKTSDETITKGWKEKSGGVKIKVGKDGDVKIKDENGKTKYDADDDKIKTDKDKNKSDSSH